MAEITEEKTEQEDKVKREYTLHFIISSSIGQEEILKSKESVNEKIQNAGGQIESSLCQEGAKKLAYQVKKNLAGNVCESVFLIDPENIGQINASLKQDANLLRFMLQSKREMPKNYNRRIRKRPLTKTFSAESEQPQTSLDKETQDAKEKRDKVSIEEIDKKLDEIIKNI